MEKKHSVFIDLTIEEVAQLLHPIFKRKGWLKDVPNEAELIPFEDGTCSFEYLWEEKIY